MKEWIATARAMRLESKTIDEIAAAVGKSRSRVQMEIKDIPYTKAPWKEAARRMRAEGVKLPDIAAHVQRSITVVIDACRGVVCPVNHRQITARKNIEIARVAYMAKVAARPPKPQREPRIKTPRLKAPRIKRVRPAPDTSWHEQCRTERQNGETREVLAARYGVGTGKIQWVCRGIRLPKPGKKQRVKSVQVRPVSRTMWHLYARMGRAEGMKIGDLAHQFGVKYNTMRSAVAGVVCPYDHGKAYQEASHVAAIQRKQQLRDQRDEEREDQRRERLATRREQQAQRQAEKEARKAERKALRQDSEPVVRTAEMEAIEKRRRQIAKALMHSHRRPAPITLPTLKFMEKPLAP